jgi:hypothetical protein
METRDSDRLDSWKEIAAFIARDERTAMRWAKRFGMPVHHAPGGTHARVFAYRSEVQAWVQLQDHPDRVPGQSAPATSGHAGPPTRPALGITDREYPVSEKEASPESVAPKVGLLSYLQRRKWLVIGGLTLIVALLLLGELLTTR